MRVLKIPWYLLKWHLFGKKSAVNHSPFSSIMKKGTELKKSGGILIGKGANDVMKPYHGVNQERDLNIRMIQIHPSVPEFLESR